MRFARSPKLAPKLGSTLAVVFLIVCGPSARGEQVRLLETDRSAFQTRLRLIETATQTLDIACFIIRDDCVSHRFLEAVVDAAHRGVCVRLIVDSMFNDIDDCMLRRLLAAGAQIREYHPLSVTRPCTLSRRMHDKILIRDGVEMVVGSRNLEDAHFGIGVVVENFVDIDLHVTGCVLHHANAYYQCLWDSEQLGDLQPAENFRLTRIFGSMARACVGTGQSSMRILPVCKRDSDDSDPMRCCVDRYDRLMSGGCRCRPEHNELSVPCVKLLHDPEGKKKRHAGVRPALYQILDNAQCSIVLQSPYIIPAGELARILRCAAQRGVCVRILTNSVHSTNKMLAYSAFSREAPKCARAGVKFWEYGGPKCLHAKSFVVDGHIACITSFNFDSRSEHLNTELATVIDDEVFAAELLAAMERNFCESYPMRLRGRKLVSCPQLDAANTARAGQPRGYGSFSTLSRILGVGRVSRSGLPFLQGLSRLIQRQL